MIISKELKFVKVSHQGVFLKKKKLSLIDLFFFFYYSCILNIMKSLKNQLT